MPDYKGYRIFLSDVEEKLLYKVMGLVDENEKNIVCGIIAKFSLNYMCKK